MSDYYFDEAAWMAYGEHNPAPLVTRTDGGHTVKTIQPSGSIRFASDSPTMAIDAYKSTQAGRTYAVLQDGVEVSVVVVPAEAPESGEYEWVTLATGLDTGSVHEYEVICITPIAGPTSSWYERAVRLTGGGLAAVAHPARFIWGVYGDSIACAAFGHLTDAGSPLITDARLSDTWIACQANGSAMAISGVAGGKVVNTGRDNTANIPTNADAVALRYGTNDMSDFPGGNATFQQAYSDMVDNIRTRIGAGKPIVCFQPVPRDDSDNRALCESLIQAAISGKADVYYVNTDGWLTDLDNHTHDGLHPNVAGYAEMATHFQAAFDPYEPGYSTATIGTFTIGTLNIG